MPRLFLDHKNICVDVCVGGKCFFVILALEFSIGAFKFANTTSVLPCNFLIIARGPVDDSAVHEDGSSENTNDTTAIVDGKSIKRIINAQITDKIRTPVHCETTKDTKSECST